jgi:hypothetical protein
VVDATGNADVAFFAGAGHTIASDLQAITYHFRLGNVHGSRNWSELEQICRNAMDRALADGKIECYGGPWLIRLADGEISVNSTRLRGNPTDPVQLTDLERCGRGEMLKIWEALRAYAPELRDSYILSGATQVHIRESRKVIGQYTLTEEDLLQRRHFEDSIAVGAWPVDIHPSDGFVGVHPHKENPPEPYEIPYRCLVPREIDNLLIAGRPISTTHRAHGSTRVPGTSLATGHAAGVAAALAAKSGVSPRHLPVNPIQETLIRQNARLFSRACAPGPE